MLKTKDSWDKLSMYEKADLIKYAVQNGIYNPDTVRQAYNEYADGGRMESNDSMTLEQQPMQTDRMLVQWVNNLIEQKRNHDVRLFALGGNMYHDGGEMTRVRLSDGSYAYVRTKDGHAITGGTGKYDLYDANGKVIGRGVGDSFPHTGSGLNFDADEKRIQQYLGDYEEPVVTPQGVTSSLAPIDWAKESSNLFQNRVQAERNKEIARNKAIDAKVSQYAFTPEGFFDIATRPAFTLLSPANTGRALYNIATGNGEGNIAQQLFSYNNGVFSDEFAAEHPYLTMAGNVLTDALTFGTGAALWKMPKYRAAMQAENRAAQKAMANSWDDMLNRGSIVRTKVGDVEINNPQLAYRQGGKGIVDDFIETGMVVIPEEDYAASNMVKGKHGFTFDLGAKTFDNPIFEQGALWYGLPRDGKPVGLLTTAEPLGIGTPKTNLVKSNLNGTFDLRYSDVGNSGRRVQLYDGQLNHNNTSAYLYEPGYGYRKVTQEPSTISWDDAQYIPQVDWNPDTWFKNISGRSSYSPEEAAELASFVPEYNQIEQRLFNEGTLFKDANGNIRVKGSNMSPQEYIMRQSKEFQKMDKGHRYTGVGKSHIDTFEDNNDLTTFFDNGEPRRKFRVWADAKDPKNVEEYAYSGFGGVTIDDDIAEAENLLNEALQEAKTKLDIDVERVEGAKGTISEAEYNRLIQLVNQSYQGKLEMIDKYKRKPLEQLKLQKENDPLRGGRVYDITYPENVRALTVDAEGRKWDNIPGINLYESDPSLFYHNKRLAEGTRWSTDHIADRASKGGYDIIRVNDVMDTGNGTLLDDVIINEDVPVKSVLGNTGAFDITGKNKFKLYRSMFPFIFGGGTAATLYGNGQK